MKHFELLQSINKGTKHLIHFSQTGHFRPLMKTADLQIGLPLMISPPEQI